MTTEAILTLLPYLLPTVLPIIADITGDLLPIKYTGKLRKLLQYIRLVLKNKGQAAENRLSWAKYEKRLSATKLMLLSEPFNHVRSALFGNTEQLLRIAEDLKAQGIVPETIREIVEATRTQKAIIDEFQAMYNRAIGGIGL